MIAIDSLYNKEITEQLIKNDRLLDFRLKTIMRLEEKDYDEAVFEIFNNFILDDEFKYSDYIRLSKKVK